MCEGVGVCNCGVWCVCVRVSVCVVPMSGTMSE